jgi:hypothetical protein
MLDHHIFAFEIAKERADTRRREAHTFGLLRSTRRAARQDAARRDAARDDAATTAGARAVVPAAPVAATAPGHVGPGRLPSCCAAPAGM